MRKLKKILGITALVTTLSLTNCTYSKKNEEPTTEEFTKYFVDNSDEYYNSSDENQYPAKDIKLIRFTNETTNETKYYIAHLLYDYSYTKNAHETKDTVKRFKEIIENSFIDVDIDYDKLVVTENYCKYYFISESNFFDANVNYVCRNISYTDGEYHIYSNNTRTEFSSDEGKYSYNCENIFDTEGNIFNFYIGSDYFNKEDNREETSKDEITIFLYDFNKVFGYDNDDILSEEELLKIQEECNKPDFKPIIYVNKLK